MYTDDLHYRYHRVMNRWAATVLRLARRAIEGREPSDRCRSCAFRVHPESLPPGERRGTAINLARALYEARSFHCHKGRRFDGKWAPDAGRVCQGFAALPDPQALRHIAGLAVGATSDAEAAAITLELAQAFGWSHPEEDA